MHDTDEDDNLDRIAGMASDYIDEQVDYDLPASFLDGATPLDHEHMTMKLKVGYFDGQEVTTDLSVEFIKLSYTDHFAVHLSVRGDTDAAVLVRRDVVKPLAEQVMNLHNAAIKRQDRNWPH
jgi:hypothetical protein